MNQSRNKDLFSCYIILINLGKWFHVIVTNYTAVHFHIKESIL